ncbi:MAG: ribonuclease catalytic domain-containing protein, partial [bacterium]
MNDKQHRSILRTIARRAMMERGLLPDFTSQAIAELDGIRGPALKVEGSIRDLRNLVWCSMDNDDSLDLDQLTVAIPMPGDALNILVAIADVDAIVKKQSALDDHAKHNTTSVYTAAEIFPMLPEKLSTDLTSLNFESDRLAIIVEMTIDRDGSLEGSDIYQAIVRSRAKLAYNSVADWLEGSGPSQQAIDTVNGLAEVKDLEVDKRNRAKDIIEDFMISANGVTAQYLASKEFPSLRRVVRTPKRWDRIV